MARLPRARAAAIRPPPPPGTTPARLLPAAPASLLASVHRLSPEGAVSTAIGLGPDPVGRGKRHHTAPWPSAPTAPGFGPLTSSRPSTPQRLGRVQRYPPPAPH